MQEDATHAIELTGAELAVLVAAFEVLVDGGGQYTMLDLPGVVEIHHEIHRKLQGVWSQYHG
jgi:hypothetical protein